jgi:hypothetical protein
VVAVTVDIRAGSPAAHGWYLDGLVTGLAAVTRLSQDKYSSGHVPINAVILRLVGDTGLEPVTSCMSSKCSNQLS